VNLDEMMTDAVAALDELWQDPAETAAEHRRLLHRMHEEEQLEEAADTAPAQEPLPSTVAPLVKAVAKAAANWDAAAAQLATRRPATHAPRAADTGTAAQEARHPERGWFKSSHSSFTTGFVAVRFIDGEVQVRELGEPNHPALVFNRDEWDAFLQGVFEGEFQAEDSRRPIQQSKS
jgi:Domain of unknown function (DUF397)